MSEQNQTGTRQSIGGSLTDVAKHFRKRLRHEGISARCKSYVSCGSQWIQVSQPESLETSFTDEQQKTIRLIALACHLTRARGLPIDLNRMTDTKSATFQYGAQS